MAGEDPGVGVITLVLDIAQRAANTVLGFFKGIGSAIVDIAKMLVFMSWRRQARQQGQGPELKHGKQSLKHLRRHEDRGAQLISAEIGDRQAMKALDKELKALAIDYAITGNRSDGYTLHYKSINEQDVLMAQARALDNLYGSPDQNEPDQETPNDSDDRDQQDREERQDDGRDREQDQRDDERQDDEERRDDRQDDQTQDEQSDREDRSQDESRQNEQDTRDEQERQNQQEQERQDRERREDGRRDESAPAPIPVPAEVGESSPSDKASRGKHARQETPSLAERMPATPSQTQRASQTQAQAKDAPQFEPLESLIAKARERAAAKNAARTHAIDRTKDRVRAREVNFSH